MFSKTLAKETDELNEFALEIFWGLLLGIICGTVPKCATQRRTVYGRVLRSS